MGMHERSRCKVGGEQRRAGNIHRPHPAIRHCMVGQSATRAIALEVMGTYVNIHVESQARVDLRSNNQRHCLSLARCEKVQ